MRKIKSLVTRVKMLQHFSWLMIFLFILTISVSHAQTLRTSVDYNNSGKASFIKGDLDGAIADFTKAIEINPLLAETYNSRGVVWSFKGNLKEAIRDFDRAIKLDSRYAMAYANRGLMRLL